VLACIDCGGAIEPGSAESDSLRCSGCGRVFPIRDDILDLLPRIAGNNRIAADYYDGPLWPKFRFWERFAYLMNGGERRARAQVMRHLPDLSGTRLLDVAIGDGGNLPLVPEDCLVFGNDISTVQLLGCRRRFPRRGIRLVFGEAERLPFREATFDNALSYGALNYFNDPLGALREMARVVRPGGTIVVCDEVPDLADRMPGRKLGLPGLDRWILSRVMHLGADFTAMVDRHRGLQLEPIVREALDAWTIHSIWRGLGYCIVGTPKAGPGRA
jgi:ubiquinone/menaquinone biosynthesis C-methylase UbiE